MKKRITKKCHHRIQTTLLALLITLLSFQSHLFFPSVHYNQIVAADYNLTKEQMHNSKLRCSSLLKGQLNIQCKILIQQSFKSGLIQATCIGSGTYPTSQKELAQAPVMLCHCPLFKEIRGKNLPKQPPQHPKVTTIDSDILTTEEQDSEKIIISIKEDFEEVTEYLLSLPRSELIKNDRQFIKENKIVQKKNRIPKKQLKTSTNFKKIVEIFNKNKNLNKNVRRKIVMMRKLLRKKRQQRKKIKKILKKYVPHKHPKSMKKTNKVIVRKQNKKGLVLKKLRPKAKDQLKNKKRPKKVFRKKKFYYKIDRDYYVFNSYPHHFMSH